LKTTNLKFDLGPFPPQKNSHIRVPQLTAMNSWNL